MFFDPTIRPQTKAYPRSLEALTAWLERQPSTQFYDYTDSSNCLIAQWLKSIGAEHCDLGSREVTALFGGRGDKIAFPTPWTFGAALDRARALNPKGD